MTRHRITVRGDGVELRGYIDGEMENVSDLATRMEPFGIVLASPTEHEYNPFAISEANHPPEIEASRDLVNEMRLYSRSEASFLEQVAILHFQQANVIRGERHRANVYQEYALDLLTNAIDAVDETTLGASGLAESTRESAKQALRQVITDLMLKAGPPRG